MEIYRHTLDSLSEYLFNSYYDNWWSIARSKNMGISTLRVGTKYEREIEKRYQNEGYRTHRMRKSRFGKSDLLGVADVIVTKNDAFILIACAVGRAQSNTVRKILEIRPWIPPFVKIKYYIRRKDGSEEIRDY